MNIATLLTKAARIWGSRPALRQDGFEASYTELEKAVGEVAGGLLARGLLPGERVAIWSPNRPEIVVAIIAAFRAGLVAVPINARLHPEEVRYIVGNSSAAALIADPGQDVATLRQDIPVLDIGEQARVE